MHARLILIAAAAAVSGSANAAEPAKAAPQISAGTHTPQPPVVLASADQVQAPATVDPQATATPRPHRIARVTTCRCGGQQTQPQQQ